MNSILLPCAFNLLFNLGIGQESRWWLILNAVTYTPRFTLVPRFILSLRALHAHSVQGRCGSDIDTAFGLGSSSDHGAGSAIDIMGGGQNEEEDQGEELVEERYEGQGEEIQMEVRGMPSVGSIA